MAVSSYVRGNEIVTRAEFRVPDEDGTLTDPTTITFTVKLQDRDSTATAYVYGTDSEVTKASTGIYELSLTPGEGTWHVHVQGTGSVQAADETSFQIEHSMVLS